MGQGEVDEPVGGDERVDDVGLGAHRDRGGRLQQRGNRPDPGRRQLKARSILDVPVAQQHLNPALQQQRQPLRRLTRMRDPLAGGRLVQLRRFGPGAQLLVGELQRLGP